MSNQLPTDSEMPLPEFQSWIQGHFPGIEKETWYPAIGAIADGWAKNKTSQLAAEKTDTERKLTLLVSALQSQVPENIEKAFNEAGEYLFKDTWEGSFKPDFHRLTAENKALREAAEKLYNDLPLEITPSELEQDYEDRQRDYGSDYATGFSDGGQYYWQQLRDEISEGLQRISTINQPEQ